MLMAHEAEIIVPGSFVVLQGNAGDGMSNTIDTVPIDDDDDDDDENHSEMEYGSQPSRQPGDMDDEDEDEHVNNEDEFHHVENVMCVEEETEENSSPTRRNIAQRRHSSHHQAAGGVGISSNNLTPRLVGLGQLATGRPKALPTLALNRWTHNNSMSSSASSSAAAALLATREEDRFMVVTDRQQQNPAGRTSTGGKHHRRPSPPSLDSEEEAVATTATSPTRSRSVPSSTLPASTPSSSHLQQQQRQCQNNSRIEQWRLDCRDRELRQRQEWREANSEQQLPQLHHHHQQQQQQNRQQQTTPFSITTMMNILSPNENTTTNNNNNSGNNQSGSNNNHTMEADDDNFDDDNDEEWWQYHGEVAIFQEIPTTTLKHDTPSSSSLSHSNRRRRRVVNRKVIGSLSPGSTIVATDLVYLDSHTLERIAVAPITSTHGNVHTAHHKIFPRGRQGWIQLLKLEYYNEDHPKQPISSTTTVGIEGSSLASDGSQPLPPPQQEEQQPQIPVTEISTSMASSSAASAATSSFSAYVVLSLDGYPLLTPGLPSLYVDPHVWIWRVTCPAGAYVREGLDLHTRHIDTIPYGSLMRVTGKTVNGMGLSRIRVQSIIDDVPVITPTALSDLNAAAAAAAAASSPASGAPSSGATTTTTSSTTSNQQRHASNRQGQSFSFAPPRVVDGWCSEFLNPLSGQRGVVAQPLPFPVPALYRVTLAVGAVIRKEVELSSAQIGIAPLGAIVTVVARAFSDHPMDRCIERLQLAGNGGWISVRLNCPPPGDNMVVEFVGIDGTFEPDVPGQFHLQACQTVRQENTGGLATVGLTTTTNNNNNRSSTRGSSSAVVRLSSSRAAADGRRESSGGGGTTNPGDISSIDDSHSHSTSSAHSSNDVGGGAISHPNTPTIRRTASALSPRGSRHGSGGPLPPGHREGGENRKCLICLTEERNATIVHGETGHVACCLVCARILKARGDKCPVCRLNIDLVIQQFWA